MKLNFVTPQRPVERPADGSLNDISNAFHLTPSLSPASHVALIDRTTPGAAPIDIKPPRKKDKPE